MTGHLFSYSITSGIVLACLSIVYRLLMSGTTLFRFNRACILAIYLLAAVAPFVAVAPVATESAATVSNITATIVESPVAQSHGIPFVKHLIIIYVIGVAIMSLRLIANILYLLILKFTSTKSIIRGFEVRIHRNERLSPFSWGGCVFVAKSFTETADVGKTAILAHEHAHCNSRHWLDLIISNLTLVIQWYNPAAWMLHNDLIDVHEFEADRRAIDGIIDPTTYQLLLIKTTAGDRFHAIADSLNHSSLKKRITMMMKNQSKSSARLRSLALLPAVAVALLVSNSSCVKSACDKAEAEDVAETANPQTEATAQPTEQSLDEMKVDAYGNTDDQVASSAEIAVQAQYPGGYGELYRLLGETINFVGDEGKVVVGFTIDKEGNLLNPHIIKGVSEATNNEAIRAVKSLSDKWIPAKDADGNALTVTFALPINFVIAKAPANRNTPKE